MPIVKPSDINKVRWADLAAGPDIAEPLEGQKDTGWLNADIPPHETFNWWKNQVYQWMQFLNDPKGLAGGGTAIDATGGDGDGTGLIGRGGATDGWGIEGYSAGEGVGIYGESSGATAAAYGVYGQALNAGDGVFGTSVNGRGVRGTGKTFGGYFQALSTGGIGVRGIGVGGAGGQFSVNTGTGDGVTGVGGATAGAGVKGTSNANAANSHGVWGTSPNTATYGVFAEATNPTGGHALKAEAQNGRAGWFENAGTNEAVFIEAKGSLSSVSIALRAISYAATSGNVDGKQGIYGQGGDGFGTDKNGGHGVTGKGGSNTGTGTPGAGLFGEALDIDGAIAVLGDARISGGALNDDLVGLKGYGDGLAGTAGYGVWGVGGANSAGVHGDGGAGGAGVTGQGGAGANGVEGTGGSASGIGVLGTGGTTNGVGVKGVGVGSGNGVFGQSSGSANSVGVYASATGSGRGLEVLSTSSESGIKCDTSGGTNVPLELISPTTEGDIRFTVKTAVPASLSVGDCFVADIGADPTGPGTNTNKRLYFNIGGTLYFAALYN